MVAPVGGTVTMAWANADPGTGTVLWLQRLDGESPIGAPTDLASASSVEVAGDTAFEVVRASLAGPGEYPVLQLGRGWNLVGIPLMTQQTGGDILIDAAGQALSRGRAHAWSGRCYRAAADGILNAERGYWIHDGGTGSVIETNIREVDR
jgi:hypothetical protein